MTSNTKQKIKKIKKRNLHFSGIFYKIVKFICKLFIKKYKCNILPKPEPCVYLCRHSAYKSALILHSFFKFDFHTYVLSCFFTFKETYKQYRDYTFSKRIGKSKFWSVIPAFFGALFVPLFFKSAKAIPVYRNSLGIIKTLKESTNCLVNGENILILPDIDYASDNDVETDIYVGFLYLEKFYYNKTKKHLKFVPLNIDNKKREIIELESISFNDGDFKEQLPTIKSLIKSKIQNKL